MKKFVTLATWSILVTGSILMTGCSNSDIYSGDVYTADQAKQVQQVSYGTVVSVRPVKIQTNASDGQNNNIVGSLGGAVLGGFLGNTVGNGKGNSLAIAGGAIGGALAGGALQDELSKANAVQLEIKQESGSTIVIVQKGSADQFYAGQPVKMVTNGKQINVSPRESSELNK
ncbi:hypothetical protein PT273_06960 [Orbaceae bacterium ESL0727]|nr:hypothetical protein [Orbaceae bacterium ESL0727]